MPILFSILVAFGISVLVAGVISLVASRWPSRPPTEVLDLLGAMAEPSVRMRRYDGDELRLNCWHVFRDTALLRALRNEFVKTVRAHVNDWRDIAMIFPVTAPAYAFIKGVEDPRIAKLVTPIPGVRPSSSHTGRVVLFDLVINSGETLQGAIPSVKELGWDIAGYWTTMFNDLEGSRSSKIKVCFSKRSKDAPSRLFLYVYKGSDLFKRSPSSLDQLKRGAAEESKQVDEQCLRVEAGVF